MTDDIAELKRHIAKTVRLAEIAAECGFHELVLEIEANLSDLQQWVEMIVAAERGRGLPQ